MRKYLIPICLLLALQSTLLKAQNTGFGGKRFILKTDLINGSRSPLFSATTEFIATRHFTLSAGFRATKGQYNQVYFRSEYEYYGNTRNGALRDKAEISSKDLSLEARLYMSGVVPAPRGSFFFGTYKYGSADVKGNFYHTLKNDYNSNYYSASDEKYYSYEANDVNFWSFELGYGYQSFINKRFTWGFKLGFNKTFFNYNEKYEGKELSGVAKTFGPNLIRLSSTLDFASYGFGSEVQSSSQKNYYTNSYGLVFYLQIGVLIF